MAKAPTKRTAMDTVTIGCKLPNGFIMQVGEVTHTIKGFNQNHVIGGHGITSDVPKELWEAWHAENKDRAMCKNGFVFANESTRSTNDEAQEKSDNGSGTEPLPPPKEDTL